MPYPFIVAATICVCVSTLAAQDQNLALRRAVLAGDAASAAEAIKAGGSAETVFGKTTVALEAATLRDVPVLQVLRDSGVDMKKLHISGWNILNLALADARCKPEFVKFALDCGVVPDRKFCPAGALATPAAFNNVEIAKILLDAGAGTDRFPGQSYSPLQTAVQFGSPEVVKLLIDRNADSSVMPEGNWTLFHCLANRQPGDPRTSEIARLISAIDDPNELDVRNWTPLMFACFNDNLDAANALIDHGASVDSPEGGWALVTAALHADVELVKLLLKHGAPPDADLRGMTAVHAVLYGSDPGMMDRYTKSLARAGSRSKDDEENSLLRMVRLRPVEKLRALIDAGADVDARDASDWRPIAAAARLWDLDSQQDSAGRPRRRPEMERYLRAQDPVAICRMLLDAGAVVRESDEVSPIAVAANRVDDNRAPLLKLLREAAAKKPTKTP